MKWALVIDVVHRRFRVWMLPCVRRSVGSYHLAASIFVVVRAALSRAGARSVSREARTTTS